MAHRLVSPSELAERLGEADLNRRAGSQLDLLAGCRHHQGGPRASANSRTGAGTALAAEQPANKGTSARPDPDLLGVVCLGAFGLIRDRLGSPLVAVAVDVECVETKR